MSPRQPRSEVRSAGDGGSVPAGPAPGFEMPGSGSAAEGLMSAIGGTEETFRGLLESAPDAMVIVDAAGRVVLVNAQTEKLFGYAREELIGERVEMLVPDRFRERHPGHRESYSSEPHT